MNTHASMQDFEESSKSLSDYMKMFRRRKRIMAIVAACVMVLVVLITFLWPPTYRSEAIILIEEQDVPQELVRSTITGYAVKRLQEIQQRIMTIGNIMGIVEQFNLYTERELDKKTRTEIAEEFREAVTMSPVSAEVVDPRSGRPTQAVIAFNLSYDGDVPSKVQKVTSELTTLFLNENLKDRTEQTQSTSEFLTTESKVLSEELDRLGAELAKFKEEKKGALPEFHQFNLSILDRTETAISELIFQQKELEKRLIRLKSELVTLDPVAPVILESGQRVLGDVDRLKSLESEFRKKSVSYEKNHPDLIRLEREIESLSASVGSINNLDENAKQLQLERDKLAALKDKYTEKHPQIIAAEKLITQLENSLLATSKSKEEITPDNPAYLIFETQVKSTEEDIRVNQQTIEKLKEKLEKYESYISQTPQVEKQLQVLYRDLQETQAKYQSIRVKQVSADLSQSLETEQKGERFTLIQPPELPVEPISPNRVALILLGFILAGGAGVAIAILLESLDDAIYTRAEIISITGAEPLVNVSYMETIDEQAKHNKKRIYIILGLFAIGIVVLVLFHYFIKPLDVTWFILLRKLGIG